MLEDNSKSNPPVEMTAQESSLATNDVGLADIVHDCECYKQDHTKQKGKHLCFGKF